VPEVNDKKNPEAEVNQGFNILRPHHRSGALSCSAPATIRKKSKIVKYHYDTKYYHFLKTTIVSFFLF